MCLPTIGRRQAGRFESLHPHKILTFFIKNDQHNTPHVHLYPCQQ